MAFRKIAQISIRPETLELLRKRKAKYIQKQEGQKTTWDQFLLEKTKNGEKE